MTNTEDEYGVARNIEADAIPLWNRRSSCTRPLRSSPLQLGISRVWAAIPVIIATYCLLLVSSMAEAAVATPAECRADKLNAVARASKELLSCDAEEARLSIVAPACVSRVHQDLVAAFRVADSAGVCDTTGVGDSVDAALATFAEDILALIHRHTASVCRSTALEAAGELAHHILAASSANAMKPDDAKLAAANRAALRQFDSSFSEAHRPADCADAVDNTRIRDRVNKFVESVEGGEFRLLSAADVTSFNRVARQAEATWKYTLAKFGDGDDARAAAAKAIAAIPGVIDVTLQTDAIDITHETGMHLMLSTLSGDVL